MKTLFCFLCALLLAACGGSGDDGEKAGTEPLGVSITDALKTDCPNGGVVINQGIDTNRNGKLDADELSSAETVCNGVDGVDGTDNKITRSIYCNGDIPNSTLTATYSVDMFAAGDLFAAASIYDALIEVGASLMYSKGQVGVDTAPVYFTYDVSGTANGGYWKMSLNRTTLVSYFEYNDIDVSGGKLTWSMSPSDCIVNIY